MRSAATLSEEHRLIAHLRGNGMPIPAVLSNSGGQTATALGDWTYEVHERGAGIDLYREAISWRRRCRTYEHARSAGRMLAALHRRGRGL